MTRNSAENTHHYPVCSTQAGASDQVLQFSLNELMKCGDALRKDDRRFVQDGDNTSLTTRTANHCNRWIGLCDILDEVLEITSDYETIVNRVPTDGAMLGQ